eukprot:CAMPEP_0184647016 /NCGR_PEP_ID=MMETSP0308-20130426/3860_1 /TAXON_ID=38269 /ORGANISM="Gloeochaete witrockiana, Strain SAG 46.84" /LENGTH=557 /DNA_ID=CAMNT_0027077613 /DNA_START=1211 /DNA_END=2888 /DNA_ORIENTATION=-
MSKLQGPLTDSDQSCYDQSSPLEGSPHAQVVKLPATTTKRPVSFHVDLSSREDPQGHPTSLTESHPSIQEPPPSSSLFPPTTTHPQTAPVTTRRASIVFRAVPNTTTTATPSPPPPLPPRRHSNVIHIIPHLNTPDPSATPPPPSRVVPDPSSHHTPDPSASPAIAPHAILPDSSSRCHSSNASHPDHPDPLRRHPNIIHLPQPSTPGPTATPPPTPSLLPDHQPSPRSLVAIPDQSPRALPPRPQQQELVIPLLSSPALAAVRLDFPASNQKTGGGGRRTPPTLSRSNSRTSTKPEATTPTLLNASPSCPLLPSANSSSSSPSFDPQPSPSPDLPIRKKTRASWGGVADEFSSPMPTPRNVRSSWGGADEITELPVFKGVRSSWGGCSEEPLSTPRGGGGGGGETTARAQRGVVGLETPRGGQREGGGEVPMTPRSWLAHVRGSTDGGTPRSGPLRVETYENQRWWAGLGWSEKLLPRDPPHYSDKMGKYSRPQVAFKLLQGYVWTSEWTLDFDGREEEHGGWHYGNNQWCDWSPSEGEARSTRRRKWTRSMDALV